MNHPPLLLDQLEQKTVQALLLPMDEVKMKIKNDVSKDNDEDKNENEDHEMTVEV
jgi:hypothetical protein